MAARLTWWMAAAVATLATASCGGIAVIDAEAGGGGFGAQGAMAGTGGTGASGATGGTAGSGGVEPHPCGGPAALTCGLETFCDYQPSYCGGDGALGMCRLTPDDCYDVYRPVCACDGNVYANDCEANAARQDLNWLGGCPTPTAMYPCGVGFCDAGWLYCRLSLSDVAGWDHEYGCYSYPPSCGASPTCDCLIDEPCGQWCTDDGSGNLTLTCPGG